MRSLQQSSYDKSSQRLLTVALGIAHHQRFNGLTDRCVILYLCTHLNHCWGHFIGETSGLNGFEEVIEFFISDSLSFRFSDCAGDGVVSKTLLFYS